MAFKTMDTKCLPVLEFYCASHNQHVKIIIYTVILGNLITELMFELWGNRRVLKRTFPVPCSI